MENYARGFFMLEEALAEEELKSLCEPLSF